jgi:hypothetical protein
MNFGLQDYTHLITVPYYYLDLSVDFNGPFSYEDKSHNRVIFSMPSFARWTAFC